MLQNLLYRRTLPNSLTDTGQELHNLGAATDICVTKVKYLYIRK